MCLRCVQVTLEESDGDEPVRRPSDDAEGADDEYDLDESAALTAHRRRLLQHHQQDRDDGDDDDDDHNHDHVVDDDEENDADDDGDDTDDDDDVAPDSLGSDRNQDPQPSAASPYQATEM